LPPHLAPPLVPYTTLFRSERLRRSYSIASIAGSEPDAIRIAVTYVEGGRATARLFSMEPGECIEAIGPFGRLILRDDPPGRYLLDRKSTRLNSSHVSISYA